MDQYEHPHESSRGHENDTRPTRKMGSAKEIDMVETIDVQTGFGPIHFVGRDTGAPVILLITGTFANVNQMDRLQDRFPAADVLRAHLPGNHCPPLMDASISMFADAFTEALDVRFAGRPVILVGLSVGALVAFAIRSTLVRAILAVEPPLVMAEAWPLESLPQQAAPGNEAFLWNVIGLGRETMEPRDYRALVPQISVPTHVLLGDPPPPRGPLRETLPGLVGPLGRAAFRVNPLITIEDLPGVGHHVVRYAAPELLAAIQRTAELAFGPVVARMTLPKGVTLPARLSAPGPGPRRAPG